MTIDVAASRVVFSIDAVTVYVFDGDFSFDTIQVSLTGPAFRPDTVAYFDDLSLIPNASCDISMNQAVYVDGDIVSAPVFRISNATTVGLAAEIKAWIGPFGGANAQVINAGADGSLVLPPSFDLDFGPVALFHVAPGIPRGAYAFGCRLLDPVSGTALATSLNEFVVSDETSQRPRLGRRAAPPKAVPASSAHDA